MNRPPTADREGFGSDTLLAAYQLLVETTVDSTSDDILLQRALAVVAAVPWSAAHRFFSAFLPTTDGRSLRLAAMTAGAANPPPCVNASSAACICGQALILPGRLTMIEAEGAASRPPCNPTGTGTHLVLPLAARGKVLGVLHALVDTGHLPGTREQSFLMQVATLLGAELHRRQSEREHDRLEMQFLQAQKMEAVGRLAGGVAHDFNNILTAITNYADLGLLKLPAESQLRRNFDEIIAATERAAQLTQQLLAFSRRHAQAPRVIDVNTVIADMGKTLKRLLGADVELSITTGASHSRITADPALIEQLVINLAVGTRDSMPRGGAIALSTAFVEIDAAYSLRHPGVAPGGYVNLSFNAKGPGMATEYLDAIGTPEVSSREQRSCVTLGTAAVNDIIQQGGGHARSETSPDRGTTVHISFPAANPDLSGTTARNTTFDMPHGDERILLVEDDDSVRVVMAEILRDLGYEVLEAREGREAFAVAEAYSGRIDIMLADVTLPGLGGGELQGRLRATRPELRVLFISGIMDELYSQSRLADPDAVFLQKPFSPWTLASRVRQVLDAPPAKRQ